MEKLCQFSGGIAIATKPEDGGFVFFKVSQWRDACLVLNPRRTTLPMAEGLLHMVYTATPSLFFWADLSSGGSAHTTGSSRGLR